MTRLDAIKKRLEAATPGPWCSMVGIEGEFCDQVISSYDRNDALSIDTVAGPPDSGIDNWKADAEFIAQAPDDITYLLTIVEKLQAVVEEAEDWSCSNCGMILGYGPDDDEDQPCECCKKLYERIVEARRAECE